MVHRYVILSLIVTTLFLKVRQIYYSFKKNEYSAEKKISVDFVILILMIIISILLYNSIKIYENS
jgi:ABC-type Mn2+/Zn2+ transport system permease subunit